ncbi:DUF1702 family protein [Amycolatopsis sp. lyj-108]|uniref:DUF1702 family protein n=1 Tax=Amycolatopsis sp. lyj-108 TaxID=2789286 RepID=UPI00397C4697
MRRLLFTPKLADVTFAGRGFPVGTPKRRLEAIPQAVVCGFEWADARVPFSRTSASGSRWHGFPGHCGRRCCPTSLPARSTPR